MKPRAAAQLLLLFLLANLLLIGWALTPRRSAGELRLTFLDVGQGDAAVLESPSGKVMVVDAGGLLPDGDDQGRRVVAPFLRSRGIYRLDALLLTHPDADHIGGAASLLERLPVGVLLENGQLEHDSSPVAAAVVRKAQARRVPLRILRRGQLLDFGDGVTAQVLAPDGTGFAISDNEASLVLRVEYGRTAFLLTGDAEAGSEAEMLRSGQPLASDLLKVGHHGSLSSTTEPFVAAVRPRLAVISCGARNLYGHPGRRVLETLEKAGARLYRTDKQGAITCLSDGVSLRVAAALAPGQPR
jgi:competence protein ComEC